jgi:hypothetical protein
VQQQNGEKRTGDILKMIDYIEKIEAGNLLLIRAR